MQFQNLYLWKSRLFIFSYDIFKNGWGKHDNCRGEWGVLNGGFVLCLVFLRWGECADERLQVNRSPYHAFPLHQVPFVTMKEIKWSHLIKVAIKQSLCQWFITRLNSFVWILSYKTITSVSSLIKIIVWTLILCFTDVAFLSYIISRRLLHLCDTNLY